MSDVTLGEVYRYARETRKTMEERMESYEKGAEKTTEGIHEIQITLAADLAARDARAEEHVKRGKRSVVYISVAGVAIAALQAANLFKGWLA